ncbi:MAG: nuclear transport factor 2 family protein [Pasteurellaceae bacterium]|nr:nuclear transport factor 2 family protein [Pasteurellaceae bacterium]
MKKLILAMLLGAAAFNVQAKKSATQHTEKANMALVQKAMDSAFNKHDIQSIKHYFAENYIQHNPTVANGRDAFIELIQSLPENYKYEQGFITANNDIVIIYGRGLDGKNAPELAADIFRVKQGKIVEHWDVLQNSVPTSQTKSGNPMFIK